MTEIVVSARPDSVTANLPAPCWDVDMVARGGFAFHVRPAGPADETALGAFFEGVAKEDLRFRFLSAIQKVGHSQLEPLVMVDHNSTENFLAIEPGTGRILATASWILLEHVARFAASKGIRSLESVENRDNHQAIELERDMGWKATPCPGDSTLVILKTYLQPPLKAPAVKG